MAKTKEVIELDKGEAKLHSECYVYFHNTYPSLRGLLCYNFNNSRDVIEGNKNKVLGLQAGRADFTFYYRNTAYFIELKTKTGKQSEAQANWESKVVAQGFTYQIARSVESFNEIILKIINPTTNETINVQEKENN